jgi:hypothetical protein
LQQSDLDLLVGRGRRRRLELEGKAVQGFTVGKGELIARVYDKTREVRKSGKDWLHMLWRPPPDAGDTIIRVEFQFRRAVLSRYSVETIADLLSYSSSLWEFATRVANDEGANSILESRQRGRPESRPRWPTTGAGTERKSGND